ncbi:MAG: ribosomal L7Ae/L30e/S12e/Gadd45 family protein [Selenomonadales bacterium]|jgi:ribosomal protein L7Ae-like RNA K-turn-binding protein|nr:ribosomal L7Ae/L30e/S12e/Gadd45 family protein [Selenomonadales bacterium]MBQ2114188.1 ribosomal L7Ae/L30e/S12e/Gadd45 family protein [Selenomonadales bacterium]MBQ2246498.1 ribosomal L7Ae/L30e/S12e/Gadd45 family protein [Selenomonadales bacterium]MBQ5636740.1 ribosomal L7Ae/L30e/S12e/Gadd45 family protein [Selenomonadales bacterium]MBR0325536.1 ribosomal L7Ae/L30e/S12e/Gadd45 family protein [Selenomonadales bacterium]
MYKSMLSLLGLAQKAGQLASGDFGAEKAIRAGKAKMILMAEDCADETKKKYRELAEEYEVDCVEAVTKIELGAAIGREFRAVVVILDDGFKKGIQKKLKTLKGEM